MTDNSTRIDSDDNVQGQSQKSSHRSPEISVIDEDINLESIEQSQETNTFQKFRNNDGNVEIKYLSKTYKKGNSVHEKNLLKAIIEKKTNNDTRTRKNQGRKRSLNTITEHTFDTIISVPTWVEWGNLENGEELKLGKRKDRIFIKGMNGEDDRLKKYLISNNNSSRDIIITFLHLLCRRHF